eukprot:4249998-Pyramimonas_sp.AAC.1
MGHHDPPDDDNGEGAEDGPPLHKMEPDYEEDEPTRPPTPSESAQEGDDNRSGGDAPQRSPSAGSSDTSREDTATS